MEKQIHDLRSGDKVTRPVAGIAAGKAMRVRNERGQESRSDERILPGLG